MNELKAHQLVLIFLCAAIGTLFAFLVLSTVPALCFGLIVGVFTYSFLLSRAEQESNIKFSDFEQPMPSQSTPADDLSQAVSAPGLSDSRFKSAVVSQETGTPVAPMANVAVESMSVAQPAATVLHTGVYKRRVARCCQCNEEIFLYTWQGHKPHDLNQPPPPIPEPVQLRWSDTASALAWVNICMRCGAIQNDDALFDEQFKNSWLDI